jgi:hypothetical protein
VIAMTTAFNKLTVSIALPSGSGFTVAIEDQLNHFFFLDSKFVAP